MGIKKELDDFHRDILLLLEFIGEDNYFRRLVGRETLEEYEYLERQVKDFREKLRELSDHDRKNLRILYNPLVKGGMTLDQVRRVTEIRLGR